MKNILPVAISGLHGAGDGYQNLCGHWQKMDIALHIAFHPEYLIQIQINQGRKEPALPRELQPEGHERAAGLELWRRENRMQGISDFVSNEKFYIIITSLSAPSVGSSSPQFRHALNN